MSALNAAAKAVLRDAGVTQAEWARHWFPVNARPGDASTQIGRPVWLGDRCGCTDDRCIGFHHLDPDDCGCLPVLLDEYLTRRAVSGQQAHGLQGPYETERDAASEPEVRAVYAAFDADPGAGKMAPHNYQMLVRACEAAGVDLGSATSYDRRILAWLAGWEPATCAVICGLISRARAQGGAQ